MLAPSPPGSTLPPSPPRKKSLQASLNLERDLREGNPDSFRLPEPPSSVGGLKRQPRWQQGIAQQQQAHPGQLRHEAQAWQRGRDALKNRPGSGVHGDLLDAGVGEGKTSRHYPGAFSRQSGDADDDGLPPDEEVGDRGREGGVGNDRQASTVPNLLPKEIYEKLSEYVIGQVRRGVAGCMGT